MSSNQTCDDLPGPGRLVDTYFYQPGGRLLEHYINRFLEKKLMRKEEKQYRMQVERELLGVIDSSFDEIQTFYESKFVTASEGQALTCNHLHWTRSGQKSVRLDLSEYLYIWGAQEIVGLDDRVLTGFCAQINNFVGPSYSKQVRARALNAAFCLLSKFPRLRRYFDLHSLLVANSSAAISHDAFYELVSTSYSLNLSESLSGWKDLVDSITANVFVNRPSLDNLFHDLAKDLPITRISLTEIPRINRVFLEMILIMLQDRCLLNSRPDFWTDPFYEFIHLRPLFEFHRQPDRTDPLVRFWAKVKLVLDESLSRPRIVLDSRNFFFLITLEMRLMDTLHSLRTRRIEDRMAMQNDKAESEFFVVFIQLCLEVLVRLFACVKRSERGRALKLNGSWVIADVVSKAKSIVHSRSNLEKTRIDAMWEKCLSDFVA